MGKSYYRSLKVIRVLKVGGKSKYVHLLEGDVIKKKYNRRNVVHVAHYQNEVNILNYLKDCNFVPKILWTNEKKKILYLSYCGHLPTNNEEIKKNIRELMVQLKKDWGIIRNKKDKNIKYVDTKNICVKNGKFYLIDFGSPNWKIKKEKKDKEKYL